MNPTAQAVHDKSRMRDAIAVAASARRLVSPRPWVGAVLETVNGQVFRAATQGQSGPHAEVGVLQAAGRAADGATLYVTLEPCSHFGKTPPCADAVIAAGIARVVIGTSDPDPRVAGRGCERLRAAGIEVTTDVESEAVCAQLAPYLHHRRVGRPYVILKVVSSLDGRFVQVGDVPHCALDAIAELDIQRLRADSDAILVGAGTVRAEDPMLAVDLPAGESVGLTPLRVVLGRAPTGARIHPCLEMSGALVEILHELAQRGVMQLLVEGGTKVAQAFHRAGLVDRYAMYFAPIFGGGAAHSFFSASEAESQSVGLRGCIVRSQTLGSALRMDVVPA